MRLYPDRPDVLVWGRWYFCPPGAVAVPFVHAFGSSVWDNDKLRDDPPIGEVRGAKQWTDGTPPSWALGQHYCGDADVWANGLPFAEAPGLLLDGDGLPQCCPRPHPPQVGLGLGADVQYTPPQKIHAWLALGVPKEKSAGGYIVAAALGLGSETESDTVLHAARATGNPLAGVDSTGQAFVFDSTDYDTDAFFDLGSNSTTLTIPFDGVYRIDWRALWTAAAFQTDPLPLYAALYVGGAPTDEQGTSLFPGASGTQAAAGSWSVTREFLAGDTLEVFVYTLPDPLVTVTVDVTLGAKFEGPPP